MKILTTAFMLTAMMISSVAIAMHHKNADSNKDGVISKEEFLKEAEERFSKIDKDGNNEISKEEMKEHRAMRKEKMKEMKEKRKEKRKEKQEDAS